MAFRGFYYNEKLNDFTIYYHEDANLEGALERHNVVRSSLECDYCYYARLGNDYRYIGAFHDLYEQFWRFWVRFGAYMSIFPLDFHMESI